VEGILEELDGEVMIIDPTRENPQDVYKLMTGIIVPRPIAFVSTVSPGGIRNLAPFSFFTAVSANPPIICFSPLVRGRDGLRKDTMANIESTREFVVHAVSATFAEQMNACSYDYPPDVDEFAVSGLTPVKSDIVKPPRVLEALVAMECRLLQAIHVSSKPLGGSIVLGEVLRFHVRDDIFVNFTIDPDRLAAIGRMGGPTYTRTTDRFQMERPNKPLTTSTLPPKTR
jgi:flavin reductase (DIM6/NTAB) family NADH-FMN oxidoreductase RutF